jgi:hypothetical protein
MNSFVGRYVNNSLLFLFIWSLVAEQIKKFPIRKINKVFRYIGTIRFDLIFKPMTKKKIKKNEFILGQF